MSRLSGFKVYINGPMLKDSGLAVGDMATIEVEFDPLSREVALPKELAIALKKDKKARNEFNKLSPSRQKEILRYLSSLRMERSIARNVARIMGHLRGEKTDAQYALVRRSHDD